METMLTDENACKMVVSGPLAAPPQVQDAGLVYWLAKYHSLLDETDQNTFAYVVKNWWSDDFAVPPNARNNLVCLLEYFAIKYSGHVESRVIVAGHELDDAAVDGTVEDDAVAKVVDPQKGRRDAAPSVMEPFFFSGQEALQKADVVLLKKDILRSLGSKRPRQSIETFENLIRDGHNVATTIRLKRSGSCSSLSNESKPKISKSDHADNFGNHIGAEGTDNMSKADQKRDSHQRRNYQES